MLIDLHIHTRTFSPCSVLDPEEAIRIAKAKRLDGICFVEHDAIWEEAKIQHLRAVHDFLVLRGIEVSTDHGHIVTFGLEGYEDELYRLERLLEQLQEVKGIAIAAHPFRDPHYLRGGYGMARPTLRPEDACRRHLFQWIKILEVYNGQNSLRENQLSVEVSRQLTLAACAGSDAHTPIEVGRCVTAFQRPVRNERELIQEIASGRLKPWGPGWQLRLEGLPDLYGVGAP